MQVGEQFVLYMKNLAHGDFGVSAKTGRDIKTTIFESFKVSAKLGVRIAAASGILRYPEVGSGVES